MSPSKIILPVERREELRRQVRHVVGLQVRPNRCQGPSYYLLHLTRVEVDAGSETGHFLLMLKLALARRCGLPFTVSPDRGSGWRGGNADGR